MSFPVKQALLMGFGPGGLTILSCKRYNCFSTQSTGIEMYIRSLAHQSAIFKPAFGWGGFDVQTKQKRPIGFKPGDMVVYANPDTLGEQEVKRAYDLVNRGSTHGIGAAVIDVGTNETMTPERFRLEMLKVAKLLQKIHQQETGKTTLLDRTLTITRNYSMPPHSDANLYLMLGYMPYGWKKGRANHQVFVYDAVQFAIDFNEPMLKDTEIGYYWNQAVPFDKNGKLRDQLGDPAAFSIIKPNTNIYSNILQKYYSVEVPLPPHRYRILIINDKRLPFPLFHGTKITENTASRHIPLISINTERTYTPAARSGSPLDQEGYIRLFQSTGNPVTN